MAYKTQTFKDRQVLTHNDMNNIISGIDELKASVNGIIDATTETDILTLTKADGSKIEYRPLDENKEFMAKESRLDANTQFGTSTSGLWYPFKNAALEVENDYVKITCDGSTSYQGIRINPPTNIPDGTRVLLSFWYKKDIAYTPPAGGAKVGLTNTSDFVINLTDEWQQVKREYTFPVNWDRIQITYGSAAEGIFYLKDFSIINLSVTTVRERIESLENNIGHPLTGKNIAIIGDSISSGGLNPYFRVLDIDVGREIQSYVTYYDVRSSSGNPTGKTIGGVALTDEMIGTLQTFTPVAEDVGKSIGQAVSYYSLDIAWGKQLATKVGAANIFNASWSGSSMISGQSSGNKVLSHAWSDYTIGRCKGRDIEGNDILPDVIFIYRGTNDYSKSPIGQLKDVDLMNYIPETDLLEDGSYSYYVAYYLTIQKLRQAYPKAIVVCCTCNNFKRNNRAGYPINNGTYTLPQMNKAIREIADTMGCHVVEFDKDGITFENMYSEGYVTDSNDIPTHPNEKGHAVMAERAYQDTKLLNLL